jgi:phosphonate transport system substrate-binding protein
MCRLFSVMIGMLLFGWATAHADGRVFSFGVLNQRNVNLTAEYWNPILKYVGDKAGLTLQLRMTKTAQENSAAIGRGEFDFVYSNHIFSPANAPMGYRVFAHPTEEMIQGEIVTLEDGPVKNLRDLEGKDVAFPSPSAFVGYAVTLDGLLRAGVNVKPVFAGNQEGAAGQLKAGRVAAASMNSQIMREYAQRENLKYRVLWISEKYHNLPLAAHPRVPAELVAAVRDAFVSMAKDASGRRILEASAELVKQKPPYGFSPSDDGDYDNYRKFYKNTLVKGL